MTIPTIGPRGGAGDSEAAPERVTNSQVLRVLAFLIVVVPTAISVNVLLWAAALWVGRQ